MKKMSDLRPSCLSVVDRLLQRLADCGSECDSTGMNMSEFKRELLSLPPDQQDMLSAFLVSVRLKRDGLLKLVDDRLNDNEPGNWIAWEDLKPELGDC